MPYIEPSERNVDNCLLRVGKVCKFSKYKKIQYYFWKSEVAVVGGIFDRQLVAHLLQRETYDYRCSY